MATAPKKKAAEPETDEVPSTFKLYEDDKVKIKGVHQLSGDEEVAARTAPDAPVDGKFRAEFTLSGRDYDANADNDDMHRANQVATLERALHRGVHPKGEAGLEGTRTLHDGSVVLTYAVEAIPAGEDEAAYATQTPRKAITDMGGSTMESAQRPVETAKK